MTDMEKIDLLEQKMMMFNHHDPMRIQHLMKVHRFAQMIGRMEKLDTHTQFVTECAALVHDIGIRPSEEKYGRSDGNLQEQEGPAYAHAMLEELEMDAEDTVTGNGATHGNDRAVDGQRSCGISESQPYPSEKADPLRAAARYDDWPRV